MGQEQSKKELEKVEHETFIEIKFKNTQKSLKGTINQN